jgi:hypothetical protein
MEKLRLEFTGLFSQGDIQILYENENIECQSIKLKCDFTQHIDTKTESWNELKSKFPNNKLVGFKEFCLAYDRAISEYNDYLKS